MNIVLSEKETGKAFSKKLEDAGIFLGKKIGNEVQLDSIGLNGFVGKVTGGSDKQGFSMHPSLQGTQRRKVLIGKGIGSRIKEKGIRKRISLRGNTVSEETAQLNLVITKKGTIKLEEAFGKKEENKEAKPEEKKEVKTEKPAEKKEEPAKPKEEKKTEKLEEIKVEVKEVKAVKPAEEKLEEKKEEIKLEEKPKEEKKKEVKEKEPEKLKEEVKEQKE
ncbi:MAG: S6e family ribosomal protein [archaeon]